MIALPDVLHIHVTQEDIDNGHPNTPRTCPVALAVRRALGVPDNVYVSVGAIVKVSVGAIVRVSELAYKIPPDVRDFIADYDAGFPVRPFEADLEIVGP